MNLYLKCEEFEKYLVKKEETLGGIQYRFKFDNGYGSSVVKHLGSYGHDRDLWELAVIWYSHPEEDIWDLTYDTDITDDVIGYLTDKEVIIILKQINELS